jgi:hypothetical protein
MHGLGWVAVRRLGLGCMLPRVGMAALGSLDRSIVPCEQPEVVRHVERERLELCSGQAPMRLGPARPGPAAHFCFACTIVSFRCGLCEERE